MNDRRLDTRRRLTPRGPALVRPGRPPRPAPSGRAPGQPRLADISGEPDVERTALASGAVGCAPETAALIAEGKLGDVLGVARLAGLGAARRAGALLPLHHDLRVTGAVVDLALDVERGRVLIRAEIRAFDRAGVETEAMSAVLVAALAVFDQVKAVDPGIRVEEVTLESFRTGAQVDWNR